MAKQSKLPIRRRPETFFNDDKRVILRYLELNSASRVRGIFRRIMSLPEEQIASLLEEIRAHFASRHRDIDEAWERSCQQVAKHMRTMPPMSARRRQLVGAYFTMEYSIESAALFNPSIVLHPDQQGLPPGEARFLMSLRATGEGHLSSIVFRRGVIDPEGHIRFDPPPRYAYTAWPSADPVFEKSMFRRKLRDLDELEEPARKMLQELPETFTVSQLRAALDRRLKRKNTSPTLSTIARELLWLSEANYTLEFPADCFPSETVIFPATRHESRGMEDVRLVRFVDDGQTTYYGTYTAYDGSHMHPMILETRDFLKFHIGTMTGRYVRNKGMALFPRKVNGQYLMLARHDGEKNFLLRSQDLYVWNHSQKLQDPDEAWELMQVGNCGSPLETDAGWLVLTHGVGPMREYCIGALLLDLHDPSRVIGRLRRPLLVPTGDEREGYVPNVVYSCGSMIHGENLIIPYAMSDSRTAFATVPVGDLLDRLRNETVGVNVP